MKAIQYLWRLEQRNKDNPECLESWLSELYDKVGVVDVPLDEFLDRFVPCDMSNYPQSGIADPFKTLRRLNVKDEKQMYDPLVHAFNAMMMDIHGDVDGLTFLRRDKKSIPTPYKELAPAMSKTFPDIIGVLPGTPVDEEAPWSQIGLVVEIKGANHLDPMDSASQRANADLVQIADTALNLLSAHGAQYAYVLHVLGCFARIYRFDHASAVVSRCFDYIDKHQFISKFFYRLLRPPYSDQIVLNGQDNFSFAVTESFVRGLGIPGLIEEDLYWNRVVTIPSVSRHFLTLRPIHFGSRLFSRATLVQEGLQVYRRSLPEDRRLTREDSNGTSPSLQRKGKAHSINNTWGLVPHGQARRGDDADSSSMVVEHSGAPDVPIEQARADDSVDSRAGRPKDSSSSARDDLLDGFLIERVIIKEQYRQTERMNEVVHYNKINAYLEKHNIPNYGLAKMLYGEDLGSSCSLHVTISATAKDPKNGPQNERSHMRVVLDTVGESLDKFTSTKQLVQAIRDAIIGHLLAYLSGVLHRDVSFGNVMLVRKGVVKLCGFIHDFDYSSPVDSSKFRWKGRQGTPLQGVSLQGTPLSTDERKNLRELENELKERAGTVEFMAMELIDADPKTGVPHQAHHDLESFFWLLVCVVLRHTHHDHRKGKDAVAEIFGATTPRQARERKETIFYRKMFTVKDNAPLNYLLKKLRSMVFHAYIWEGPMFENITQIPVPLTYDAMLEVFDEALGMEGWPEDDAAIPFKPPYSETEGGRDVKIDAGVIGTFRPLKLDVAGPALPSRGGSAPSLPSEPRDADMTQTRPKRGTGRGGEAKSTRSQASGRGTKRKQPIRTRSTAQQTDVDAESSKAAAGPPTTDPGRTAAGAEPPRKKRRTKNWSELVPPREMHERKAKRARRT
ncbi:hypothetical protein WOLCODRAFT_167705 [Wolfiporia cocos MD-104 SS10]|uniref:Fungal-type protein kinase domain-containing protein n=1 Tax=Wolfiporia cocos (strain MD-104) TaxID=742152 RepID=A0A2H3J9L6_WOLCO|nr:hypothetical protein WOLCODRAFT_167705 [Wolfiporia cocos MD-104 SS10]